MALYGPEISLEHIPQVGMAGCWVFASLTSPVRPDFFPEHLHQLALPAWQKDFHFSDSPNHLLISNSCFVPLVDIKWYLIALICLSLITSEFEHLFLLSWVTYLSPSGNYPLTVLAHFSSSFPSLPPSLHALLSFTYRYLILLECRLVYGRW